MQRSSVVLPEPLGPIPTTPSPVPTDNDTSRSTSSVPNRLLMPVISSIGRRCVPACSVAVEDASFKVFPIQREGIADAEIDRRRAQEDLERRQRAFDDFPARHG